MSNLKILFALSPRKNEENENIILNTYKEKYKKEFSFNKQYYLQGILEDLEEEHYDIVMIYERLNKRDPVTAGFVEAVLDRHDNTRLILLIDDAHKNDTFIKQLFSLGCYNCLYLEDFHPMRVADLIENPRKRKNAKIYYGIDDEITNVEKLSQVVNVTSLAEIPEDEIDIVLNNFNSATLENIRELWSLAEETYTFPQCAYLVTIFNERVINLIESSGIKLNKYKNVLKKEVAKATINENVQKVTDAVEKAIGKKKDVEPEIVVKEVPVEVIKEVPIEVIKEVEKEVYVDREVEKIVHKEVVKEVVRDVCKDVYITPDDYKKIVAIVGGARKVGTTTIIEQVAQTFNKEGKKIAVFDFTLNKDLFDRHIFGDEDGFESLQEILQGTNRPYLIDKRYSLYTSSPTRINQPQKEDMIRILNYIKNKNDIVLVDIELRDLPVIYHMLSRVMVVISQDVTNAKYFSDIMTQLIDEEPGLKNDKKIQFIINKYLRLGTRVLSDSNIVNCYESKIENYLDPNSSIKYLISDLPILKIPFSADVLANSYKGEYIDIPTEIEEDIRVIARSIYPLNKQRNEKGGFLKKIIK